MEVMSAAETISKAKNDKLRPEVTAAAAAAASSTMSQDLLTNIMKRIHGFIIIQRQ